MATSSIFKDVKPRDKIAVLKLVRALERSSESRATEVTMSRPVSEMTKSEIQKLFEDNDEGV